VAGAQPFPHHSLLGERQKAARGDDLIASHDHSPVVEGRVRIEDRLEELSGYLPVDADSCCGVVLEPNFALEGYEGTVVPAAQALDCADSLRDGLAVQPRAVAGQGTPYVAEAAKLVQRSAELWLEHDDDGDQDEKACVLEQPTDEHKVELRRDHPDHSEQNQPD